VPKRVAQWAIVRVRTKDGAVLMRRRGKDEVNAGQWEVPLTAPGARLPRGAKPVGAVRHGILETAYEVEAFVSRTTLAPRGERWITSEERARLPLTTLTRKLLKLLPG
jgi:adenine-specific DNA glycosylase